MYTESDDPSISVVAMLQFCISRPRAVLAEWVDPTLGLYGRDTDSIVAPYDSWMLVLGAHVSGPCEFAGVHLKVGEYLRGSLRENILVAIPPRQSYQLVLPRCVAGSPHMAERDMSKLPGRFRLFGWQFGDDEYTRWLKRSEFWRHVDDGERKDLEAT